MITIQLTEIPNNETVLTRVFTLPKSGGNFGSAFDCLMHLPDRSGQVHAVHGQFVLSQHNMSVEGLNGGKIHLNGKPLAPGRLGVIEDGTMIEVGDYTLLISEVPEELLTAEEDELKQPVKNDNNLQQAHFSLAGLTMDNNDDVVMKSNQSAPESKQENSPYSTHFSASGVFSDDPFGEDPFAEEEINWQNENLSAVPSQDEQEVNAQNDATVSTYDDNLSSKKFDNIGHNNSAANAEILPLNHFQQETKVDQLVALIDRKLSNTNEQQNMLFQALDKTLATFLDEFSPQHLAETYDDYGRPLFVGKEQQYWRLYRKSFNRRFSKGEYQRLFKALLLENMQGGQD
ncbi:MAG: type VI secretion system-associated FHA domain protein [Colwellia sp.]